MSETTPPPGAYALGAELRDARKSARYGLRTLANELGLSHSVVVRWEKGDRVPSTESVAAVLAVLRVTGDQRDHMLDLARQAVEEPSNSVSVGDTGMADQLTALVRYEKDATAITDVSPLLVPGLLQTADYARAIMGSGTTLSDIDTRVALRLGRRDIITRDRAPVQFTALIAENVLHCPIGGPQVLADQLRYVRKLNEQDNVEIRVIPTSAGFTSAHAGPFVVLEFATGHSIVHLEHHRSSVFLRNETDVRAYLVAREDIERVSLDGAESIKLVDEAIRKAEAA